MALERQSQADWGAGIQRTARAAGNGFYDGLNALIGDDGLPFKRGGTINHSTVDAAATLRAVYDFNLPPGIRTVLGHASSFQVLSGTSPVTVGNSDFAIPAGARGATAGSFAVFPGRHTGVTVAHVLIYGGSLKTAAYSTGTVSVSLASQTVTGVGTAWLANVDAGMIFAPSGSDYFGVVKSVDSDTVLQLRTGWDGLTTAGNTYTLKPVSTDQAVGTVRWAGLDTACVAVVGTPARMVLCTGSRILMSQFTNTSTFIDSTNYHELPSQAEIIGAEGVGDRLMLFTKDGIYEISGMMLDPFDELGNIQHRVDRVNGDVILWGQQGVTTAADRVAVAAVDDIYLIAPGGTAEPIGGGIRPLYRSYVTAGYQPGLMATHRGHLWLPILSGTTLIDILVCRLDRGGAWTRWSNVATGFAARAGSQPKLLGCKGLRVVDATGTLDPAAANKNDADGTTPQFSLETNDFATGPNDTLNNVRRVRWTYELEDAASDNPTLVPAWAEGQEGSSYVTLPGLAFEEPTGTVPKTWAVNQGVRRIRYRLQSAGPSAKLRVHRVESFIRPSQRP